MKLYWFQYHYNTDNYNGKTLLVKFDDCFYNIGGVVWKGRFSHQTYSDIPRIEIKYDLISWADFRPSYEIPIIRDDQ